MISELVYDRGNHFDFMRQEKVLAGAGVLAQETLFDFDFTDVNMKEESYNGLNVRLRYMMGWIIANNRYYLKFTMERSLAANVVREQDLWVIGYGIHFLNWDTDDIRRTGRFLLLCSYGSGY